MARVIEIIVTGDEGGYSAAVQRVTDQNRKLGTESRRAAEQANIGFQRMTGGLQNLAGVFGVALGAGAMLGFIKNIVTLGDRLSDLSDSTGLSIKTLGGLRPIVEASGASIEDFAKGMRAMMRSLVEANDSSSKQAESLKKLGISTKDMIRFMSDPDGFIRAYSEGLAKLPTVAERLAVAQELGSKAGAKQMAVFMEIAERGLPQLSDETARAYRVLGNLADQFVRAAAEATDFWASVAGRVARGLGFDKTLSEEIAEEISQTEDHLRILNRLSIVNPHFAATMEATEKRLIALRRMQENVLKGEQEAPAKPPLLGPDPKSIQEQKKALDAANELMKKVTEMNNKLNMVRAERISDWDEFFKSGMETIDALFEEELRTTRDLQVADAARIAREDELRQQLGDKIRDSQNKIFEEEKKLGEAAEKNRASAVERRNQAEILGSETRINLLEQEFKLAQQANAPHEQLIDIAARLNQAENERIDLQIRQLENQRNMILNAIEQEQIEQGSVEGLIELINRQIDQQKVLRDQTGATLRETIRSQEVTLNLGREISRGIGDAFMGVILGTSTLGEVGKNFMNAMLRSVVQFFADVFVKKLSFESLVFSNLKGFAPQANAALAAGAGIPTGGGLFGGGSMDVLASVFKNLVLPGVGGALLGGLIGKNPLGGNIGGAIGGIAGNLLGNLVIPSVTLGSTVFSGFTASGILGEALGGVVGTGLGATLGSFILPGIGSLLGGLFGGLFGGPSKHKRLSPVRRAKAAQAALESTQAAGFQLTEEEINMLMQAAQTGIVMPGVSFSPPVGTEKISTPLLVALLEQLRAKGGRALSGVPDAVAELARRGLPGGTPTEIFAALGEQKKSEELAAKEAAERARIQEIMESLTEEIKAQTDDLKLQMEIVGKTATETAKIRTAREMTLLTEKGLSQAQIESLKVLAQERDHLAEMLDKRKQQVAFAESFTDVIRNAVNSVDPKNAFNSFFTRFSEAISSVTTDALVEAFVRQEVQPLVAGPAFQKIQDILTQIGKPSRFAADFMIQRIGVVPPILTTERAFELIQPEVGTLRGNLENLRPIFEATIELARILREEIATGFGTKPVQNQTFDITINGNIDSEDRLRELLRQMGALLGGGTAPPAG